MSQDLPGDKTRRAMHQGGRVLDPSQSCCLHRLVTRRASGLLGCADVPVLVDRSERSTFGLEFRRGCPAGTLPRGQCGKCSVSLCSVNRCSVHRQPRKAASPAVRVAAQRRCQLRRQLHRPRASRRSSYTTTSVALMRNAAMSASVNATASTTLGDELRQATTVLVVTVDTCWRVGVYVNCRVREAEACWADLSGVLGRGRARIRPTTAHLAVELATCYYYYHGDDYYYIRRGRTTHGLRSFALKNYSICME
ncbi:hypothetical protein HPB51_000790 [Rhipicephalus microplus]|uniref:Uncharacterized protein n=1 Tax=Rhipicephalus microplus TaxID=6941 RepID=A0A9J6EKR5_RHIMP|nr:hypothetical protein HPB51_000790 [Rhipicephalus microplus]